MKPPPFAYHAPATVAEALELLARLENARILAGGQSLMPMLNMRFVLPDHLIDINGIVDLAYIRREGDWLEIGAMTRQRDLEFSDELRKSCPLLVEAILNVGHRQTRNRGTLGGSLCHLDPAAEMPSVAAVYDAEIMIAGPKGRRSMPFAEFAQGYMTPALEPDEMLVALRYPLWPAQSGYSFVEYARRHGDFAIASAAVLMETDSGGRIARASLALGGVGAVPVRLSEAIEMLEGQKGSPSLFEAAARAARSIDAMEDALITADYRRHLAGVLLKRALLSAYGRAIGGPTPGILAA